MVDDKVAVVAGVGPGIGARFVETFAQGGYRVVALARNASSLEQIRAGMVQWRSGASSGQLISPIQSRSRKPFFVCGTNWDRRTC